MERVTMIVYFTVASERVATASEVPCYCRNGLKEQLTFKMRLSLYVPLTLTLKYTVLPTECIHVFRVIFYNKKKLVFVQKSINLLVFLMKVVSTSVRYKFGSCNVCSIQFFI
jgi:hypothetical protein